MADWFSGVGDGLGFGVGVGVGVFGVGVLIRLWRNSTCYRSLMSWIGFGLVGVLVLV
jgi:hypothetical protein